MKVFQYASLALAVSCLEAALITSFSEAATWPGRAPLYGTHLQHESLRGLIEGDPERGFRFLPADGERDAAWGDVRLITFPDMPADPNASFPPLQVRLADGSAIPGWLLELDHTTVSMLGPARERLTFDRAGLRGLSARAGETLVLHDAFDQLDPLRWQTRGQVELAPEVPTLTPSQLQLKSPESAIELRQLEPIDAGWLELTYHDTSAIRKGRRWSIALRFGSPQSEIRSLLIRPGWAEDMIEVESSHAAWLHVLPVTRTAGWHRLGVRFGPSGTQLTLDDLPLGQGAPPLGPMIGLGIQVESPDRDASTQADPLALDEITLTRRRAPRRAQLDEPALDSVSRAAGDQLFGTLLSGNEDGIRLDLGVNAAPVRLNWDEVADVSFQRTQRADKPLSGWWVELLFRPNATQGPGETARLTGVLERASRSSLTLRVPYLAESISFPNAQIAQVRQLGPRTRRILDPHPHHIGDQWVADLDPPHPESDELRFQFVLDQPPTEETTLAIDVIQLIGVRGTPVYSELVRDGQLRARLWLNNQPLADLNDHLTVFNDTPVRLQIPIPRGSLRQGENQFTLSQTGSNDDPNQRDDFGILGIALESKWAPTPRVEAGAARP